MLLNDKPTGHQPSVLRHLPLDRNGSSGTIVGITGVTKIHRIFAFKGPHEAKLLWCPRFHGKLLHMNTSESFRSLVGPRMARAGAMA